MKYPKNSLLAVFLITLLIQGCVTDSPRSNRGRVTVSAQDPGSTDPVDPDFDGEVYWFSSNQKIEGALALNSDFSSSLYLAGSSINDYISGGRETSAFCLEATFSSLLASTTRLKAVPTPLNDFVKGTQEWRLRIDLDQESSSQSLCQNQTGTTTGIAFTLEDSCPNCNSIYSSSGLTLYESDSGISSSTVVSTSALSLAELSLRVTPNNSGNNPLPPSNACQESVCITQSFQCCGTENQCVNEGTERPNASSSPDYLLAKKIIETEPQRIRDYPNLFFLCRQSTADPDDDDDDDTNPGDDAQTALDELIAMKACLDEVADTATYTNCAPTADIAAYQSIQQNVWKMCGCSYSPTPTNPNNLYCPDYKLKSETDSQGNISAITCDFPPNIVTTFPSRFSLSTRSVPHRFFNTAGDAVDDWEDEFSSTAPPTMEGTEFSYDDEGAKSSPQNVTNNMNAILGQMKVDLSSAFPAKTLTIEYNKTYTLSSSEGAITPCPLCKGGTWNNFLYPYPAVNDTYGLRAKGHTTSREDFSGNSARANYEDTIFGRACWVPPTMIAQTHEENAVVQTQRLNRLESQATLFMNGLQRDWYGFNRGALIGSFDGVKWFAIGTSRTVTATSNKLFLAINSPYGDLASYSEFEIIVDEDTSGIATTKDYDPSKSLYEEGQNIGASCRRWHQCETDTDCITQLGWEYTCSNIAALKTKWPRFNSLGEEVVNDFREVSLSSLFNVDTSISTKRCVYRGRGAPCSIDPLDGALSAARQKALTCAPNFYCEELTESAFNDQITREVDILDVFKFGHERNSLGRPLYYLSPAMTSSLPANTQTALTNNLDLLHSGAVNWGLCRPGKPFNDGTQSQQALHQGIAPINDTDYISQIGSCNSGTTTDALRASSCPVLEYDSTKREYTDYQDPAEVIANNAPKARYQNSCGAESEDGGGNPTFTDIILSTLNFTTGNSIPGFVDNACLRRAGQVCFTNRDCSPHIEMSRLAQGLDISVFGNTNAEKSFWEENLICGQAEPVPTNEYDEDYDITKNRCCREISKDFTFFTANHSGNSTAFSTDPIFDILSESTLEDLENLDEGSAPPAMNGAHDYGSDGRYSRLESVINETNYTQDQSLFPVIPDLAVLNNTVLDGSLGLENQWKAFRMVGESTCCGGGWIRKFADGSHDWTVRNRFSFDPRNFRCLNYTNPVNGLPQDNLSLTAIYGTGTANYSFYQSQLCYRPTEDGCIQTSLSDANDFEMKAPENLPATNVTVDFFPVLDTSSTPYTAEYKSKRNSYAPYIAVPTADSASLDDQGNQVPYIINTGAGTGTVRLVLPSYLYHNGATTNIQSVRFIYDNGTSLASSNCVEAGAPPCFYNISTVNDLRVIEVDITNGGAWTYGGIRVSFRPIGGPGATGFDSYGMTPGNSMYYLSKLGRLELLGIPQVFNQPLYCNDNRSLTIPNLYSSSMTTYATGETTLMQMYDSSNPSTGDDDSLTTDKIIFHNAIDHPRIFSENEFNCCRPLGKKTDDGATCCTGFSQANNDGEQICKLPAGTNLNTYFNAYVSSEGRDEGDTGSPLTDDDFVAETGEPKYQYATYNKIIALGLKFCENERTRTGGVFGNFPGEPSSGSYVEENGLDDNTREPLTRFSFVDSETDNEVDSAGNPSNGMNAYQNGFKWNHHIYCDD